MYTHLFIVFEINRYIETEGERERERERAIERDREIERERERESARERDTKRERARETQREGERERERERNTKKERERERQKKRKELRWAKSPIAKCSANAVDSQCLSQAIPRFHVDRTLDQQTPITRFEPPCSDSKFYVDQILSFRRSYDCQRTLVIRVAAIALASDSARTTAQFHPSKYRRKSKTCGRNQLSWNYMHVTSQCWSLTVLPGPVTF